MIKDCKFYSIDGNHCTHKENNDIRTKGSYSHKRILKKRCNGKFCPLLKSKIKIISK